MSYLFGYKMRFKNVEEITVTANIYDTLSGEGETVFTEIEGSDDPLHIFTIDNDEEKFTAIKAKQAEIKFLSTTETNLTSFLTPEDNRWQVEILVGDQVVFKGFLILDDIDEDFLDSEYSNTVTLLATDNIGLLKDEPLTNFTDNNPRGYFNLITYVAWCLQKTGLTININVVHNVKEEHDSTRVMYETCFLQSKTFEAEINESTDCYEVLEQILGNDCYLTQAGGEWWIIRVDDLQDNETYNNVFDTNGVFVRQETFDIPLRIDPELEVMFFSDMATFVKAQQAVKNIKLTYDYELPKEIIDNIDFSRGTERTDLTPPADHVYYTIDDWRLWKNAAHQTAENDAYIDKKIIDGYEKERYVVITKSPILSYYYIESNPVPINQGDKFNFSVDWRFPEDQSGSGFYTSAIAHIELRGDNGFVYGLEYVHGAANQAPAVWRGSGSDVMHQAKYEDENQSEWITVSVDAPPVPVSGEIIIRLVHASQEVTSLDKHFQNLQFTYIPLINGSYQKYNGQYNKVSQAISTKKVYEDNVQLSDSPKKLFKGALHIEAISAQVTASLTFSTEVGVNTIIVHGSDVRNTFGQVIKITGTANNDGFYTILNRLYAFGNTLLVVSETVVPETVTASIKRITHELAGRFYDGRQFSDTVPEDEFLHPFGFNQAYCVWNQYNRVFRIFDFQLQGLNGGSVFPDIIGKYTIGEDSAHTMNKLFMMLHYDQDLNLCEWSGVMVEFFDTTIPKDYASPLEFKYISDKG